MTTANAQGSVGSTIKAYQDKIAAQIRDAKSKLEQFEATAKDKGAQQEAAAVSRLNAVKQNIDRKLQDIKSTNATLVSRAKADIDADVAMFKASIDELATRVKTPSGRRSDIPENECGKKESNEIAQVVRE
jgi:uncharacterized phage infection (PIP) family protein YhgE